MGDRSDMIVQYFDYLIKEYEYHIEQKDFYPKMFEDAIVVFKSSSIRVEIVVEKNRALIRMGNQADSQRDWFEFPDVLKHYAPMIKAYIFPEKTSKNTWDEIVENQLQRLAVILRQHCESVLKGDLSGKEQIKAIEEKRNAKWFAHRKN